MSKQAKKEQKAAKRAAREAALRKQRQQTMWTTVIVAIVVVIGGVLVWVSLDTGPSEQELAEQQQELEDLLAELEAETEDAGDADAAEDAGSADADEGADGDADADGAEDALEASPGEALAEPGAGPVTPPVDTDREVACGGEQPPGADAERAAYEAPEVVIEDGVDYRARITTSCGEILVDLLEEESPTTVNSFLFLVGEGFYDGLEFTRIDPSITVLQVGSPSNTQSGGPGYRFADELDAAEERGYPAGSLAMANSGPDTNGSQFFLVYGDNADGLPRAYTLFGEVLEGAEVMEELAAIPTGGDTGQVPTERLYIESITIETS